MLGSAHLSPVLGSARLRFLRDPQRSGILHGGRGPCFLPVGSRSVTGSWPSAPSSCAHLPPGPGASGMWSAVWSRPRRPEGEDHLQGQCGVLESPWGLAMEARHPPGRAHTAPAAPQGRALPVRLPGVHERTAPVLRDRSTGHLAFPRFLLDLGSVHICVTSARACKIRTTATVVGTASPWPHHKTTSTDRQEHHANNECHPLLKLALHGDGTRGADESSTGRRAHSSRTSGGQCTGLQAQAAECGHWSRRLPARRPQASARAPTPRLTTRAVGGPVS